MTRDDLDAAEYYSAKSWYREAMERHAESNDPDSRPLPPFDPFGMKLDAAQPVELAA